MDLPCGFTYSAIPLFNTDSETVNEVSIELQALPLLDTLEPLTKAKIPVTGTLNPPKMVESILTDPRRIPYGFLGLSPHPGFDPDRFDKSQTRVSAIYGTSISFGRKALPVGPEIKREITTVSGPSGYTTKRFPILWPCKSALTGKPTDFDFPIHTKLVLDIVHPHLQTLQRILTIVRYINQDVSSITTEKSVHGGYFEYNLRIISCN